MVAIETKVSCDQALDKLSEKLNSRLLVQEEHGFQKGAQCAPWSQELKKSLAWIGLKPALVTVSEGFPSAKDSHFFNAL